MWPWPRSGTEQRKKSYNRTYRYRMCGLPVVHVCSRKGAGTIKYGLTELAFHGEDCLHLPTDDSLISTTLECSQLPWAICIKLGEQHS